MAWQAANKKNTPRPNDERENVAGKAGESAARLFPTSWPESRGPR